MGYALNAIAAHADKGVALEGGDTFADAMSLPGADAYEVKLSEIHPSWYPSQFGMGLRFNSGSNGVGTDPVPVLQVLWPDRDGRYPGEAGFDGNFTDRQPMLWLPRPLHPASIWVN